MGFLLNSFRRSLQSADSEAISPIKKLINFLLEVDFPPQLLNLLPDDKRSAAIGVLSHDPRPSYQRNAERIYGLSFAGFDLRFRVEDNKLTVLKVTPTKKG